MKFDLPKESPSIIKVIGVGGGGSNAVNHMFNEGIRGVEFVICNTDNQALDMSPIPTKVQLGNTLTGGRGAGSLPEVGKNAAIETIDEVKEIINSNTQMVFVTAGMGGGTGTGAAPIIAKTAREMGILTVGIVTMPFSFEGKRRRQQAEEGIKAIRDAVDSLIVINNDRLRLMYGNLKMSEAFGKADNVLTTAAKGIAELITRTGHINVDFADVCTVMQDSGVAIMGSAVAQGEDRALKAVELALASPLLDDNDIKGARHILLNIEFGSLEPDMDEISEMTDYIQEEAGYDTNVIFGYGQDDSLGDEIRVTIIATGFKTDEKSGIDIFNEKKKPRVHELENNDNKLIKPVVSNEPEVKQTSVFDEPQIKAVGSESTSNSIDFDLEKDKLETPKTEQAPTNLDEPTILKRSEAVEENNTPKEDFHITEPTTKQSETRLSVEEANKMTRDRVSNLQNYASKYKSPVSINEMEKVPAFLRKQIQLDDVEHSSESHASRLSLDDNEKGGLRSNNAFLHDNVD